MPDTSARPELTWTGERYIPGVHGDVEVEHLHRYCLARECAKDKDVLDIACGEGYGSAILAEVARSVVGVDISRDAVRHAAGRYRKPHMHFVAGSCGQIPLADASVDLVVSFETIEHHDEHREMVREFARILRPEGTVIISTPDKAEYSDRPGFQNEFHVQELYFEEFRELLLDYFPNIRFYGQCVRFGSFVGPVDGRPGSMANFHMSSGRPHRFSGLPNPTYFVAVASRRGLIDLPAGVLTPEVPEYVRQISQLESAARERDQAISGLGQQLTELNQQFTDLNQRLAESNARTESLRRQLEVQKQESATRELERRQIQHSLAERQAVLDGVLASRSWTMTQPFRDLVQLLKRRPLSSTLRSLGSRIRATSVEGGPASEPKGRDDPWVAAESTGELWPADGKREWEDYASLRNRIAEIAVSDSARSGVQVPPIHDLAGEDLAGVVSRLRLPDPGDEPVVTIVVPAYNHVRLTVECLLSIAERTGRETAYEVLVADDASTDETRDLLSRVDNLGIVSQPSNQGFLRNVNAAAKSARGRYLVLLNNDVQVLDGWLAPLVRAFEENDAGAAGPMMLYPDGRLQEAGARVRRDGSTEMIGLGASPAEARFRYRREVEYCSGAALMVDSGLFAELGGFDERYAPAYCEDVDLCLRIRKAGKKVVYCPDSRVVHRLSQTAHETQEKMECVVRNTQQLVETWGAELDRGDDVRIVAFYLPQFHPIPENDQWWGKGFTEWTNVARARPRFPGHYQPREPADLGHYDLRVPGLMDEQASLARRYGIDGFCFHYYWFGGKRLLEYPIESMLETGRPGFPFCLCWANENWTRRWDGKDDEILIGQMHSDEDDAAVIHDLMRYFKSSSYIRVNGRPLLLVYRVTEFPDFARTAELWRRTCREEGIGEICLTSAESFDLAANGVDPETLGCDAAVEFPPHGYMPQAGETVDRFPGFHGHVADYRELLLRFAARPHPGYKRFPCVVPGWDNTPRRPADGTVFHGSSPGAFQAWTEAAIETAKRHLCGEERIVFVNAWNEWAEGAYLEPDRRFGHTYLEAITNARESSLIWPDLSAGKGGGASS